MTRIANNCDTPLKPDYGLPHGHTYYVPRLHEHPLDRYADAEMSQYRKFTCDYYLTISERICKKKLVSILLTSLRAKITPDERLALVKMVGPIVGKPLAGVDDLSLRKEAIRALRYTVSPERFIFYMASLILAPIGLRNRNHSIDVPIQYQVLAGSNDTTQSLRHAALHEIANLCKEWGPRARFALPLLSKTISFTYDERTVLTSFRALGYIGAEAIPILLAWRGAVYTNERMATLRDIGFAKLADLPPWTLLTLSPEYFELLKWNL